jgi:hypothetical protein
VRLRFRIWLKLIFPSFQESVLNYRCAEPSNRTHRNYSGSRERRAGSVSVCPRLSRRELGSRGRWIPSPLTAAAICIGESSAVFLSRTLSSLSSALRAMRQLRRSFEYVPISGGLAVPRLKHVEPFCSRPPRSTREFLANSASPYPDSRYRVCGIWGAFFLRTPSAFH